MPNEPRTEAGKRLLEGLRLEGWRSQGEYGPAERIAAIEAEARAALLPPPGTRLILAADDDEFIGRTAVGDRVTFEWGEPDEHGWYAPLAQPIPEPGLDDSYARHAFRQGGYLSDPTPNDRCVWRVDGHSPYCGIARPEHDDVLAARRGGTWRWPAFTTCDCLGDDGSYLGTTCPPCGHLTHPNRRCEAALTPSPEEERP